MRDYIHFMLKDQRNGRKYSELLWGGDELVIGKNPRPVHKRFEVTTCVPILDNRISREHVRVVVIDSRLFAYDTSSNGTYVNGTKLNGEGVFLRDRDVLGLGLADDYHYDFDVRIRQKSDRGIFSGIKRCLVNALREVEE